ncbi:MAG: hypothetical protein U0271_25300 [Polyangiaceae bacterium]
MGLRPELEQKRREVERALWAGESATWLVADLVTLARESDPGSELWLFAHRELALATATEHPWRASVVARRVLDLDAGDHVAWATLGLAQSLLGNLRFAVRCYERALAISPHQPRYAHNLGHLYDVALDEPERALPLLARAHRAEPRSVEVTASYAHALGRAGRASDGLALLRPALARGATRDQQALSTWLEQLVAAAR